MAYESSFIGQRIELTSLVDASNNESLHGCMTLASAAARQAVILTKEIPRPAPLLTPSQGTGAMAVW